jgi:hypothetical protein
MTEALCIEWAKTRARAWRWTEEVDLVEEEMRRVLDFQNWKAEWWKGLISEHPGVMDESLREGLVAYAECQSQIQLDLRRRFSTNWCYVPEYIQDGRDGLGTILADTAVESGAEDDGEEEVDPDDPVPEVAWDVEVVASFVEEYLA